MKRISYAFAMCLGLMITACNSGGGSSGSPSCSSGQIAVGSSCYQSCGNNMYINSAGQCVSNSSNGNCSTCTMPYGGGIGVTHPQTGQCMPAQYANMYCGGYGGGYNGGYGWPYGGGYPGGYYGGGYQNCQYMYGRMYCYTY